MTERQEILIRADLFREVMKKAKQFNGGKKLPKAVAFLKGSGNLIVRAMTEFVAVEIKCIGGATHNTLPSNTAYVLTQLTLPKEVKDDALLTIYQHEGKMIVEAENFKVAYPITDELERFAEHATKRLPKLFEGEKNEGFCVNAKYLCEALKAFGDQQVRIHTSLDNHPINSIEPLYHHKDEVLYLKAVVVGLKD